MKGLNNKYSVKLHCSTCGSEDHFEFNEDKSYIKCTMCNREYLGGIEELKEMNVETFNEVKEQIATDAKSYIQNQLRKVFKGKKLIIIK